MKKLLLISIMVLLTITSFAQTQGNVTVLMKNGSKITGTLKSISPLEGATIVIAGIETFISMNDIEEIKDSQAASVDGPNYDSSPTRLRRRAEDLNDPEYIKMREVEKDDIPENTICSILQKFPKIKLTYTITEKASNTLGESIDKDQIMVEFAKDYSNYIRENKLNTTRKIIAPSFTNGDDYDAKAILHIVRIDGDDGEIFSYMEVFKKDDAKPSVSIYLDGEGRNGDLEKGLQAGISNMAFQFAAIF